MKSQARRPTRKGATSKTLGVVIVNYNSFADTLKCVDSLLAHRIVDKSAIVIVDNSSPDGSGRQLSAALPEISVILSQINGGFGAGINLGADRCQTDLVLVLNPDTYFVENAIDAVVKLFDDERCGIVGLNLVYTDGTPQFSARTFYSLSTIVLRRTPLGRTAYFSQLTREHLMVDAWSPNHVFEANWVIGAGFVFRRNVFLQIGGMDEKYFLYMEDTDLCRRMWRNGFRVLAIENVRLIHAHQRTSAKSAFGKQSREHLRSLARYVQLYGLPLLGHDNP